MPALAQAESSNNARAVSKAGAIGLYQIMPGENGALAHYNYFAGNEIYTERDLYNPEINARIAKWDITVSRSYFRRQGITDTIVLDMLAVNAHLMGRANTDNGIIAYKYLKKVFGQDKIKYFMSNY